MADYAKELARAHEQTNKQREDLKKKIDEKHQAPEKDTPKDNGANNTEDAYKGAPRNRDMAWRNNNVGKSGERRRFSQPRGGGERGRGRGMRGERGAWRGEGDRGFKRGGDNRRSFYRQSGEEGQDDGMYDLEKTTGEGNPFPYRGQNRGRGFRGPRGGRGGPNYRGRGGPGGRGSRRSYPNEYQNDVDYQSAEDNDDQSEDQDLLQEEIDFINDKIQQNKEKLKGIVDADAIERKCIELEFDDKKVDEWVNSLLFTDVRGLADLEWNETVTKEQKHINRVNTLHKMKIQAEKAAQRKERFEQKRIRDEEKKKKQEEIAAKKKEREERRAQKQAEQQQQEQEDEEAEENGDALEKEPVQEDTPNGDEQETAQGENQDKGKKERRKKDKSKEKSSKGQKQVYKRKEGQPMQYQAKQKPDGDKDAEEQEAGYTPKDDEAIVDDQGDYNQENCDDYYDQEEEGMNQPPEENENKENGADDEGDYTRKLSEDDCSELLANATQQHLKKDEEDRLRKLKEQEEAEAEAERLRVAEEERQREYKKKLEQEAAIAAAKAAELKKQEEDRLKKEKEEEEKLKKQQLEEEEKLLAARKKQEESQNSTTQNQQQQNQFMMNPLMAAGLGQNPMMMGMPTAPFQFDKDTDPAQIESQKQYFYQQATMYQQLAQHYFSAYTQLSMYQQLMNSSAGGSNNSNSSKSGANQFAAKPNEVPMMAPPNMMMGMLPGSLPNMAPQNLGAGLGNDQQQFMQFQQFMPMMYPTGAAPGQAFQPQNFQGKNDEK